MIDDLPTNILVEMIKRDDVTTTHLRHMILDHKIQCVSDKPPYEGDKVIVADLLRRRLGDVQVLEKLHKYGMKIDKDDCLLALELYQKDRLDIAVYKFIMGAGLPQPKDEYPVVRECWEGVGGA